MTNLGRVLCWMLLLAPAAANAHDYQFDGSMSRPVLENYLSRSITCQDLLIGKGNFDDNLRMLKSIGAKLVGRTVFVWGHEADLPRRLQLATKYAAKVHEVDPEIMLQAAAFEIVSEDVGRIAVPDWAFKALGQPVEQRNFRYADMVFADGRMRGRFAAGSVPDITRPETKLWFYYLAVSYIDAGIEAIHFGQVELMNRNDSQESDHWWQTLSLIRGYAAQHARRHFLLCDAHVPSGGLVHREHLVLDVHSFPLRIKELPDRPQEAVLQLGHRDSIYLRSRGGIAPSGWRCEHLPFLVEFDNWEASGRPGQPKAGGYYIWGYDEINWLAHQPAAYRNAWLRYASKWVRENDPAGFLEMPGARVLHVPVNGKEFYYANTPSEAVPDGFGQEDTIRAIWAAAR
jgi:hypothetical protein